MEKSSSDGAWTVYIDGIYEKHSDGSWIDYYNGFGRRIAMRSHGPQDIPGNPNYPGTVRYLLVDTLGSTSTVLNSNATVAESEKYYPYGGLRSGGITLTDKKFTGQQDEGTAFGLYDYGARFYSTVTGQFVSADPVAPKPGNPQTFDRYAYAIDNPLRYNDPTGLEPYSDLHRLADALEARHMTGDELIRQTRAQQEFATWGQAIMEAGISPDKVGDTMLLIERMVTGNLSPYETLFAGQGAGTWTGNWMYYDNTNGGFQPVLAEEYFPGTLWMKVAVVLSSADSCSQYGPNTGHLLIRDYASTPEDKALTVSITIEFSGGAVVTKTLERGATVCDFYYDPLMGYPRSMSILLAADQKKNSEWKNGAIRSWYVASQPKPIGLVPTDSLPGPYWTTQ